jgi:hypothetical protein
MKQRIKNSQFPSELRKFYAKKNQELKEAYKKYKQMTGEDRLGSMRREIEQNNRLLQEAFEKLKNNVNEIEIEWMEPNLVETHPPKFATKRERTRYDFRYDHWFENGDNL